MLIPRGVLDIHRLTSKDEQRPTLQYVHAERDRETPRLTATDGHRLLTVTWVEPEVKPDEVPADFGDLRQVPGFVGELRAESCADIARAVPHSAVPLYQHAWLEETNGNHLIRLGAGDKTFGQVVQIEATEPEMEFPNWKPLVQQVKGAVKIGVNAKLLAELLTVMSKVSGETGVVLYVPADPTEAIGIHVDSADGTRHLDGLLMPMRLDLTGRPEWEDVPVLPGTPAPVPKAEKGEEEGAAATPAPAEDASQPSLLPRKPVRINIDLDRACSKCGQKGTGDNGLCLECIGDKIIAGQTATRAAGPNEQLRLRGKRAR